MNRLAKRAWSAMLLAVILFGGLALIVVRYFSDVGMWVSFRSNPSVQVGGSINSYSVIAREGTVLLDTEGTISYADDAAVRSSLLHLLGDGGNVSSHVTNAYGDELTGFNYFGGVGTGTGKMQLTVSPMVQKTAYYAMQGKKGTVGVYNYLTGEILCMLSMPTYDPASPPETIYTTDENGETVVMDEYDSVYFNRFAWSTYIPGSTFKIVTAAAALERIDDVESRTFTCEGSVWIGGRQIACAGEKAHGELSLREALSKSCNVTFARLADEMGKEILQEYSERVHIASSIDLDGLQTKAGSLKLDAADEHAVAWAGIGQAYDQINPCQYMSFVGSIANGGRSAKPYVVASVEHNGKEKYRAETEFEDYLSQNTADRLADMMCYAVDNNYIWACDFAGLEAGGKSGTAERDGGRQDALFTGFVRDPDYPLAFIVVVEDGGAGSSTCLPIVQQVLNASVAVMNAE